MTVEALKEIGKTLGKEWNFSVDPCSGERGWGESANNNVTCIRDSADATVYHVIHM